MQLLYLNTLTPAIGPNITFICVWPPSTWPCSLPTGTQLAQLLVISFQAILDFGSGLLCRGLLPSYTYGLLLHLESSQIETSLSHDPDNFLFKNKLSFNFTPAATFLEFDAYLSVSSF